MISYPLFASTSRQEYNSAWVGSPSNVPNSSNSASPIASLPRLPVRQALTSAGLFTGIPFPVAAAHTRITRGEASGRGADSVSIGARCNPHYERGDAMASLRRKIAVVVFLALGSVGLLAEPAAAVHEDAIVDCGSTGTFTLKTQPTGAGFGAPRFTAVLLSRGAGRCLS